MIYFDLLLLKMVHQNLIFTVIKQIIHKNIIEKKGIYFICICQFHSFFSSEFEWESEKKMQKKYLSESSAEKRTLRISYFLIPFSMIYLCKMAKN